MTDLSLERRSYEFSEPCFTLHIPVTSSEYPFSVIIHLSLFHRIYAVLNCTWRKFCGIWKKV